MILTVPFPLHVAEMKIQPSLERVNVNGWLDFEIEDTSSSSKTRLFNFFSPEKRTSAAPANPQTKTKRINLALISCCMDDGELIVVNHFTWHWASVHRDTH